MGQFEIETRIRNIDERTRRMEQILPTLASRDEVQACVTRSELQEIVKTLATRDDLKIFATKDDLKAFATKEDLKAYATKQDLKAHPTRDEMTALIREEGECTRRHFDIVAERMDERFERLVEGHSALEARVGGVRRELKADIASHDKRLMRLEARTSKRR